MKFTKLSDSNLAGSRFIFYRSAAEVKQGFTDVMAKPKALSISAEHIDFNKLEKSFQTAIDTYNKKVMQDIRREYLRTKGSNPDGSIVEHDARKKSLAAMKELSAAKAAAETAMNGWMEAAKKRIALNAEKTSQDIISLMMAERREKANQPHHEEINTISDSLRSPSFLWHAKVAKEIVRVAYIEGGPEGAKEAAKRLEAQMNEKDDKKKPKGLFHKDHFTEQDLQFMLDIEAQKNPKKGESLRARYAEIEKMKKSGKDTDYQDAFNQFVGAVVVTQLEHNAIVNGRLLGLIAASREAFMDTEEGKSAAAEYIKYIKDKATDSHALHGSLDVRVKAMRAIQTPSEWAYANKKGAVLKSAQEAFESQKEQVVMHIVDKIPSEKSMERDYVKGFLLASIEDSDQSDWSKKIRDALKVLGYTPANISEISDDKLKAKDEVKEGSRYFFHAWDAGQAVHGYISGLINVGDKLFSNDTNRRDQYREYVRSVTESTGFKKQLDTLTAEYNRELKKIEEVAKKLGNKPDESKVKILISEKKREMEDKALDLIRLELQTPDQFANPEKESKELEDLKKRAKDKVRTAIPPEELNIVKQCKDPELSKNAKLLGNELRMHWDEIKNFDDYNYAIVRMSTTQDWLNDEIAAWGAIRAAYVKKFGKIKVKPSGTTGGRGRTPGGSVVTPPGRRISTGVDRTKHPAGLDPGVSIQATPDTKAPETKKSFEARVRGEVDSVLQSYRRKSSAELQKVTAGQIASEIKASAGTPKAGWRGSVQSKEGIVVEYREKSVQVPTGPVATELENMRTAAKNREALQAKRDKEKREKEELDEAEKKRLKPIAGARVARILRQKGLTLTQIKLKLKAMDLKMRQALGGSMYFAIRPDIDDGKFLTAMFYKNGNVAFRFKKATKKMLENAKKRARKSSGKRRA